MFSSIATHITRCGFPSSRGNGKKPEPEQESKRACSQKTRITAHGAPPQELKPEPFTSFPRPVLHTASGAVIPHGITACTGPRGHTVYQIGNTCRKRTRGNKGEENDGEGEKNQCRARQLVGDMPSHCLNEREKEF